MLKGGMACCCSNIIKRNRACTKRGPRCLVANKGKGKGKGKSKGRGKGTGKGKGKKQKASSAKSKPTLAPGKKLKAAAKGKAGAGKAKPKEAKPQEAKGAKKSSGASWWEKLLGGGK